MDVDEAQAWADRDGAGTAWLADHYDRIVTTTLREQGWTQDPELDDLRQEGRLALVGAIRAFDPTRGFKFTSFAIPRVVGALQEYKRSKSTWVRRTGQRALAAVSAAVLELEMHGKPVTDDAILAMLPNPGDLERVRRLPTLVYLTEDEYETLDETLPDPDFDLFSEVGARERRALLAECLLRIPRRQRAYLKWRFLRGLDDAETCKRLAKVIHQTPAFVRVRVAEPAMRRLETMIRDRAGLVDGEITRVRMGPFSDSFSIRPRLSGEAARRLVELSAALDRSAPGVVAEAIAALWQQDEVQAALRKRGSGATRTSHRRRDG